MVLVAVQVDPSYCSVLFLLLYPPNASADVCIPEPAKYPLLVFKFAGEVVQEDPSYSSVESVGPGLPPKANPTVCVPAPAKYFLAEFKAPPAVHEEPSYSSVLATCVVESRPPKAKPAVCIPAPARPFLAVLKSFCSDQLLPLYSSVFPTIPGLGS
jgi:hypothetical protein